MTLQFTPHEYQKYAIKFVDENEVAGLFLDLGLGKTAITLSAISSLLARSLVKKVLIIAPLRVAQTTWSAEITKWKHLHHIRLSKVLGSAHERNVALARKADIYIINRENVPWLVENHKFDFDMVVIDELSSFKSPKSARFRAMRKVRPFVQRIVGLTGTPAPNGLLDLWSQLALLDKGERLGKFLTHYRDRYFLPDKRNGMQIWSWKLKPGAEDEIYDRISDICLSMQAHDYLDMPERIDVTHEVEMTAKERQHYEQLKRDMVLSLEGADIDAKTAGVLANKLRQMASGIVYGEDGMTSEFHEHKLEKLEDLLESANGQPVLVFYEFIADKERIMKNFHARELKGEKDIDDWNNGDIQIAIAHPASAGHGLNLQQGGHILIWYTLPWSLELYQQANGRLLRQGQKHAVTIHTLITKGTIDEQVVARLEQKDITQSSLIKAVKAELGG